MTATGTATATATATATTRPFSGVYLPLVLDAGQGLPSPTATPLATATPTAAPIVAAIPVLSSSTYTADTGSRYIVGEVRNDTGHNVELVKITARYFGADDELLGLEFGYTLLDILTPGQRSPFAITSLVPPAGYDHYTLEVEASATEEQPLPGLTIESPEVESPPLPGSRSISGIVRNGSGDAVEGLQIVATVYDQSGTVVAAGSGYADPAELPVGRTSTFRFIVTRWDGGVRYELQAQALRR